MFRRITQYNPLMECMSNSMKYLYVAMVCSALLFACKKTAQPDPDSPANPLANQTNLLTNGNFSTEGGTDIFRNWTTIHTNKGPITPSKNGILFSGNTSGNYYIMQQVHIAAGTFYKVSITADYTLNDYSACGIYAMDSTMQTVLGKFEKVYSSATGDTWQFVFYSDTHTDVSVVVGFLNGINGTASLTGATMQEYTYEPNIVNSDFAAHMNEKYPLMFDARSFDSTISFIGDYVNDVLLSKIKFLEDSGENSVLDMLIGLDSAYAYFNEYRHRPDQVKDGYCQRSSLSLGEILTNEFHIPVRQMFMDFAGVGKHQFLEYWNPFAGRWVIIDPCFNTRYMKNNALLGDADFNKTEAPSLMIRFGTHYYYATLDDLLDLWQGYDVLEVQGYYQLTYPF